MSELVHIKDSATTDIALCGVGGDKTWTTRTSARVMATCDECLQVVMCDECFICDGRGVVPGGCDCCGHFRCRHCDIEAAADVIENQGKKPPTEGK